MIRELIEYCLTPASRRSRRSGLAYEAVAFEARARRNARAWAPHWEICRRLTRDFYGAHPDARSLALLGSGCLFEVPKEELLSRFERITLVDAVFPRSVRAWARSSQGRVELLERDLTIDPAENFGRDLVISANLLSQLSVRPLALEHEREGALTESRIESGRRRIEKGHLELLRLQRAPVLLWTDVERHYLRAGSGEILDRDRTVVSSPGVPSLEWDWRIAPAPEWDARVDLSLRMRAWRFTAEDRELGAISPEASSKRSR